MSKELVKPNIDWYQKLINDLRLLNFEGIVRTKHAIGKRILKDELKFERAEYGKKTVVNLAKDLDVNSRDIYYCTQFAKKYPKIEPVVQNLSWRKIRLLLSEHKEKSETPELPKGKYNVIYVDPPWQYLDKLIEGYGAAEHHYPTLSIEELCELPVKELAYKNSVLFLWIPTPILAQGEWPEVVKAWGFEGKSCCVWNKVRHNYGHYFSIRTEFLLLATKGSYLPELKTLPKNIIIVERTKKHSEKPEEFRHLIERMYPGKWVELFARKKIDGWDTWGNEV